MMQDTCRNDQIIVTRKRTNLLDRHVAKLKILERIFLLKEFPMQKRSPTYINTNNP